MVKRKNKPAPIDMRALQEKATAHAAQIAEGMIQADQLDDQASYLSRGRGLAGFTIEALQAHWAEAFRKMVGEQSPKNTLALSDAGAELLLRGIEPDATRVGAELAQVKAMIERSEEEHPEGNPAMQETIRNYMRRVEGEMN